MDKPDRADNKVQEDISTRSVRPFATHPDRTPVEGAGDAQSGNLTWKTLISADRTPSAEMVLGIANFPPHGKLNPHRHSPSEIYFGLSGAGTVTVDGEKFGIAEGVAIFIPSNCEHGVVAGAAGLSMAYCFAQDAFGNIEYRYTKGMEA
jgi:quercetin dioxygenase-like cupin family protein